MLWLKLPDETVSVIVLNSEKELDELGKIQILKDIYLFSPISHTFRHLWRIWIKQDYSYPFVNEVQVKFYNDMPVLTLDDLCTLFACSKSVLSSKMYNCCWPVNAFLINQG